eukprot:TRINITY_DN76710_c0_g1_i1.p1 TRINITY_DN76710_c0_g1~~TRINITY_DN76710_c0_g1_i1.p1  ORF type:complete len:214 (+),score=36.82 TRINITY_DN76710_c0_g1_i1:63-704(+)
MQIFQVCGCSIFVFMVRSVCGVTQPHDAIGESTAVEAAGSTFASGHGHVSGTHVHKNMHETLNPSLSSTLMRKEKVQQEQKIVSVAATLGANSGDFSGIPHGPLAMVDFGYSEHQKVSDPPVLISGDAGKHSAQKKRASESSAVLLERGDPPAASAATPAGNVSEDSDDSAGNASSKTTVKEGAKSVANRKTNSALCLVSILIIRSFLAVCQT